MDHTLIIGSQHKGWGQMTVDYLRQEIAFLEARLNEMGEKGDCAYEHALSKAYHVLLEERRDQFATLNAERAA